MADKAPSSPDGLQIRGAPSSSARLSKKAALAGVAVVAAILGVIITNVSKEQPKAAAEESEAKKLAPALTAAENLTRDVPDVIPAAPELYVPPPTLPPPKTGGGATPSVAEDARQADSALPGFSSEAGAGSPVAAVLRDAGLSQGERSGGRARRVGNFAGDNPDDEPANEPDLNRQSQKQAFLDKERKSSYLGSRVTAPVSPYELKTGTVIPGILISELNSDLPGEMIAQVSQNVYDTASGNHLLIPQGARLFGSYDSQVSFAQGRVLVSWERLIFPDASTLELEGMSGVDQGGKSGFADRVNNHYARVFGAALLTSTISAGYQLSQPQQVQGQVLTNQQVAAGAVGQQLAEVGTEIARRNLRVQPTIEIRKGYRLNVMVNKDVVFPGTYRP